MDTRKEKPIKFHGLQIEDIRQLIELSFNPKLWGKIDKEKCMIRHVITADEITEKRSLKLVCEVYFIGEKWPFELTISSTGFIAIENGSGVKFSIDNPIQVYSILVEKWMSAPTKGV